MTQSRYCSACGHQNLANAQFCNACGQPMPVQGAPPLAPNPAPRGSRLGLIGMLLGFIGIVCAFIPTVGPFIAFICIIVGLPMAVLGFTRNRRLGLRKRMAIFGAILHCVALVAAIISIATVDETTFKSLEDFTCEDLVNKVIELSKEKGDVEILKIYTPEEIEDSEYELECESTAQTDKGEKEIRFQLEQDAEGDWFYGYQIESGLFD